MGDSIKGPEISPYGLKPFRKYPNVLNGPVVVTEKVHGANFRMTKRDGKLYVGSRTKWKAPHTSDWYKGLDNTAPEGTGSLMWKKFLGAFDALIALITFGIFRNQAQEAFGHLFRYSLLKSRMKEGLVYYGELYGDVQDLKYGGGYKLVLFDAKGPKGWLDWDMVEAWSEELEIPLVPVLYKGPWMGEPTDILEGDSVLCPGQMKEGVVVRTQEESWDDRCGRVILKLHSQRYLLR